MALIPTLPGCGRPGDPRTTGRGCCAGPRHDRDANLGQACQHRLAFQAPQPLREIGDRRLGCGQERRQGIDEHEWLPRCRSAATSVVTRSSRSGLRQRRAPRRHHRQTSSGPNEPRRSWVRRAASRERDEGAAPLTRRARALASTSSIGRRSRGKGCSAVRRRADRDGQLLGCIVPPTSGRSRGGRRSRSRARNDSTTCSSRARAPSIHAARAVARHERPYPRQVGPLAPKRRDVGARGDDGIRHRRCAAIGLRARQHAQVRGAGRHSVAPEEQPGPQPLHARRADRAPSPAGSVEIEGQVAGLTTGQGKTRSVVRGADATLGSIRRPRIAASRSTSLRTAMATRTGAPSAVVSVDSRTSTDNCASFGRRTAASAAATPNGATSTAASARPRSSAPSRTMAVSSTARANAPRTRHDTTACAAMPVPVPSNHAGCQRRLPEGASTTRDDGEGCAAWGAGNVETARRHDVGGGSPPQPHLGFQRHAVREGRVRHRLDVLGRDVVATVEHGHRPRAVQQR